MGGEFPPANGSEEVAHNLHRPSTFVVVCRALKSFLDRPGTSSSVRLGYAGEPYVSATVRMPRRTGQHRAPRTQSDVAACRITFYEFVPGFRHDDRFGRRNCVRFSD